VTTMMIGAPASDNSVWIYFLESAACMGSLSSTVSAAYCVCLSEHG
jgi:hypothetical protein